MEMKEKIKKVSGSFFISVTLINVAMLILGSVLRPGQQFGYEVFIYPLLYGLIGIIPAIVTNTNKELTIKQTIIREIVQMIMTVVLIVAFMFAGNPMNRETIIAAVGVSISVVLIYILVLLIGWLLDCKTAHVMMEDLKRFQEEYADKTE